MDIASALNSAHLGSLASSPSVHSSITSQASHTSSHTPTQTKLKEHCSMQQQWSPSKKTSPLTHIVSEHLAFSLNHYKEKEEEEAQALSASDIQEECARPCDSGKHTATLSPAGTEDYDDTPTGTELCEERDNSLINNLFFIQ